MVHGLREVQEVAADAGESRVFGLAGSGLARNA
jgi:hypothetical protein